MSRISGVAVVVAALLAGGAARAVPLAPSGWAADAVAAGERHAGAPRVPSVCRRLYLVSLAGSASRALTPDSECVRFAAPSPDGRRLAYVSERLDGTEWRADLWIAGATGRDRRLVGPRDVDTMWERVWGWSPWSRDGRLLAYTNIDASACRDVPKWCTQQTIRVVDTAGRERALISGSGRGTTNAAWSSGGLLAFADAMDIEGSVNLALGVARRDGSGRRTIVRGVAVAHPAWLTRSAVIYSRFSRASTAVMRIDAGGSRSRELARGQAPVVSPGGRRIAYARNDALGGYSLHVMRADGRGQRRIAIPGNRRALGFAWSRDARRLAIATAARNAATPILELRVASAEGRTIRLVRRFVRIAAADALPLAWSRDGKHVYVAA